GQPVLWWSPDPRAVLFPEEFHCSRSLAKTLRNGGFEISLDRDFRAVIDGCAAPRAASPGTWITSDMRAAYLRLQRLGCAHSIEVWRRGELAGGLYGVRLGGVFFGESMFSAVRDASKVALAHLAAVCLRNSIAVIDCQLYSRHLGSLGARTIPRAQFQRLLREQASLPSPPLT
ncbi:MAG TPA: leucyl/phenylalanyl-tRNA--protein transferase, partial [Steroidobacteraceae bacterium]|nr:leucyl/phenylalanyl-tRNA--protein transferase [Steroidobacteraceae bacterium]